MWVSLLYALTFLASFFALANFLFRNKKADAQFVIIGILVCVHALGRLTVSLAGTLTNSYDGAYEMAIWATRLMNVGSVFCPVMLIFIIERLCGLRMPAFVRYPFLVFAIVVFGLSLTIGVNNWWVKLDGLGVNDYWVDGYTYLVKRSGFAQAYLYPILMLLCFGSLVYYIIYALRHRRTISQITVLCICFVPTFVIVLYLIEYFNPNLHVSLVSVGYLVGALVVQWLFTRIQSFDLTSNLANAVDRVKEFGYIEIDNKNRYINSNKLIKDLFPEIEKDWQIDRAVPVSESFLYKEVISWATDVNILDKAKTLHIDEKIFNVVVRDIYYGKRRRIGSLIEFIDKTNEYRYTEAIKNYNDNLRMEVAKKTAALRYVRDRLVIGMAEMAESRDSNTGDHIKRTSAVVDIFSHFMLENDNPYELSETFLKMVAKAAPMHDLGKIAVDDSILRKPGKLTDEEYAEMKKHSEAGAKIVESVMRGAGDEQFVDIARNIAWYHHEKWNGTGYPEGLKGEEIPVEARIMALVDVFDALVSKRCYKDAFSYDKAFSIIEESLGSHFDPTLGKVFLKCRGNIERLYDGYSSES